MGETTALALLLVMTMKKLAIPDEREQLERCPENLRWLKIRTSTLTRFGLFWKSGLPASW
jgi:hypothetical protein